MFTEENEVQVMLLSNNLFIYNYYNYCYYLLLSLFIYTEVETWPASCEWHFYCFQNVQKT